MVLRRPAHLGEAQGGAGDDAGRPAPRAAREGGGGRSTAAREKVRLEQAGEPVPEELAAAVDARPTRRCSPACARCSASTRSIAINVGAAPDAGRGARVLPRHRPASWPSCGACPRPAARGLATAPARSRSAPSGRRRQASRSSSPTTARCSIRGDVVMQGYRNQPEQDGRDDRRRRLAAHRRHRRDRRGRLPQDRRPQEGADHQRRRQEHVAGEHRVGAQGGEPAHRPGRRDRRRRAATTRR